MPFDEQEKCHVLICYRRIDTGLAQAVKTRLETSFNLKVFLDEDCHRPGYPWREMWKEQLYQAVDSDVAPNLGPTVVVIATASASQPRDPDIVVEEIFDALYPQRGITDVPIVLLRFGEEGWKELERRLVIRNTGHSGGRDPETIATQLHQPEIFKSITSYDKDREYIETVLDSCCASIVKSVRAYFIRRLVKERERTLAWAKRIVGRQLVPKQRFDRDEISKAVSDLVSKPELRSVAFVGPGGTGKTTAVARALVEALDLPDSKCFFPILLTDEDILDIDSALKRRLGLNWVSKDKVISLAEEGLHWFKDIICFVTDSLEHADDPKETAQKLRRLLGTCKLVLTSRPGAWSAARSAFAPTDTSETPADARIIELTDLKSKIVADVLDIKGSDLVSRPFLRNPVFLDICLYLAAQEQGKTSSLPDTETALLDRMRKYCLEPNEGLTNVERRLKGEANERIMKDLSRCQIERGCFYVPREKIDGHSDLLNVLIDNANYVVEEDGLIRLRHDIIDSHNIAVTSEMCSNVDVLNSTLMLLVKGFGRVLFETVMQMAHDRNAVSTIDRYFEQFLFVVDNKMTRHSESWNAGYVITARLKVFLGQIRNVLNGEYLGNRLPASNGEKLSSLHPPKLTQLALSSVAAMFGGAASFSMDDEDGCILSALRRYISSVSLRARLIEALPKINRPQEVENALEFFADDAQLVKDDPGIAQYLSSAIVEAALEDRDFEQRAYVALQKLLKPVEELHPPSHVLLRTVRHAIGEVERLLGIDMQQRIAPSTDGAFTVEELEEGLALCDRFSLGRASDWTIVERYLAIVGMQRQLQSLPLVTMLVARSLWHQHGRIHQKAYEILGILDNSRARAALLYALTFETDDVSETALIAALERQMNAVSTDSQRAKCFQLALRRALATRIGNAGQQRLVELGKIVEGSGVDRSIVTSEYVELRRYKVLPELILDQPAASLPEWLTAAERTRDVGAELEQKLSFVAGQVDTILCSGSTWATPRRLHLALHERQAFFDGICREHGIAPIMRPPSHDWKESPDFAAHLEAIMSLYESFESESPLPSIGCVHALLVTKDNQLLQARRSLGSAYYPGAWSISFEEQMRKEDLDGGRGVQTCLLRGIFEEFGVQLDLSLVTPLAASFGIEWSAANRVLLIVCRLEQDARSFMEIADISSGDREITEFGFIPMESVRNSLTHHQTGFWCFAARNSQHPTNAARLALLFNSVG
ncbi:MAG TPA: hypothetical protein VEZ52_11535 [Desulfovibrio sp.]|uniref:hypothetical protein n=1 Tax=Desulfovibrio sp. TaxID=885 RepID=UPI002D2A0EB6|nr:hypothetical protein [Desulfovibrio sp.]HZF62237.1 hypothetical protein [Desulfovibrio sp.]